MLRGAYGFAGARVASALRALAGLPGVVVEDPGQVTQSLDRGEKGMDFANALHLAAAARCEALFTFDRRFIELAGGGPVRVAES